MAIAARGGIFLTFRRSDSVDARAVALRLRGVTLGAIDSLCRDIVIGMFGREVRMTAGASIGFVNRGREFGDIYKQGNFFAGSVGFAQRLVGVTIETETIS
jgi:hypothetical protein